MRYGRVLDGERVGFSSTNDARDRGISIIHQELSLAPNLSIRDNIFMGREITGPFGGGRDAGGSQAGFHLVQVVGLMGCEGREA